MTIKGKGSYKAATAKFVGAKTRPGGGLSATAKVGPGGALSSKGKR